MGTPGKFVEVEALDPKLKYTATLGEGATKYMSSPDRNVPMLTRLEVSPF